jgi:hypothetical protein
VSAIPFLFLEKYYNRFKKVLGGLDIMTEQLSFVLPLTFHETGLPTGSWRQSPDEGATIRTRLLLQSFVKYFNQNDLLEFFIVCPGRDISCASALLSSITRNPRYKVLAEPDVCPDIKEAIDSKTGKVDGWRAQQLIKLAMAAHVSSEFYVTLDSDILCVRPSSYSALSRDGKAITNIETIGDYHRLYEKSFAERECRIKASRYKLSAEVIGYRRPRASIDRFYGETPVVLCAKSVRGLVNYLEARFQRRWSLTLAQTAGWTEYNLYFQFLEMTGQLENVCLFGGCNSVLDLERSVWQASVNYRRHRSYDADHFIGDSFDYKSGLFVAVQSWLPVSAWLPTRCETLNDFYMEVQEWLLGCTNDKAQTIRGRVNKLPLP